jgi:histidine triad (HIT) family protein
MAPPPAPVCVFCRIVAGEIEADIVTRTDEVVVFLDHRPLFAGHCLVVPRLHFETLLDLPTELDPPLWSTVRRVSRAVESGLGADGFFVAANNRISQSVPHLHVHVIPRRKKDGLKGFFWPRYKYKDRQEVDRVLAALVEALPPA